MTGIDDPSDRVLWERVAAGSGDAFGELFDRHARAVYNHCFRLTASWVRAEDLTSTVFLQAWRLRSRFQPTAATLRPWLLGVATNTVRNERRALRRRLALAARIPPPPPVADHADEVAGRVDDERRMAELLAVVRRFPRAEREALALCVCADLTYAEAAEALGIAETSVRTRVSRARSRLRAALPAAQSVPALEEER